jgi:hypothetical protein
MSHQPLPETKALSSGVLMLEAAIATIVLSFFAASSPQLFTARSATPSATAVKAIHTPQNQLLAINQPGE